MMLQLSTGWSEYQRRGEVARLLLRQLVPCAHFLVAQLCAALQALAVRAAMSGSILSALVAQAAIFLYVPGELGAVFTVRRTAVWQQIATLRRSVPAVSISFQAGLL